MNANAAAIITPITVRVIANSGKFLGADIGGAIVTIHNEETGELLATGETSGGSGNTWEMMLQPRTRQQTVPTANASSFSTVLTTTSNAPLHLRISAIGPVAGLQSKARASVTQWIVPGLTDPQNYNSITWNCLLELPGLLVQVMQPVNHLNITTLPASIDFVVDVAMMCGCPIDNNQSIPNPVNIGPPTFVNPWPSPDFIAGCLIINNGVTVDNISLQFDSTPGTPPGQYTGSWIMPASNPQEAQFFTGSVYAYQLSTGNTGTGTVSFFYTPPVTGS